jgi:uncharacterized membrane protein YkvA (DUF1232 family)
MQSWALLLVSLGVTLLVYAMLVCWLVALGRRDDARALATFIPDCIVLVSRLAREPRVPRRRKLLLLALVGYLALPFDLVPDFIPVAGQLDDAIIVALALRHFIRVGGEPLIRELWPGPERSLALILKLAQLGDGDRECAAGAGVFDVVDDVGRFARLGEREHGGAAEVDWGSVVDGERDRVG